MGTVAALFLLTLLGPLPGAATAQPARSVEMSAVPSELTLEADAIYDGLRLTLGGPDDLRIEQRAEVASRIHVGLSDSEGAALPDGLYAYELRGRVEDREVLLSSGFFSIRDGAFVSPDGVEEPGESDGAARLATKATVLATNDGVIRPSLCVGNDCAINESFGFTTLKLKENNTQIEFSDTSSTGSFPTTDWVIRANDSASGGASRLAVDEFGTGRTPFSILAGAPSNSLFVDAQGDVGIRTSAPLFDLHVVTGDTPGLRLEQDTSTGFSAQTWDVAGNEGFFFVRDVTGGADRVLLLKAGAPANSIFVDSSGDVGLGTSSPGARLDVNGDIAVAGLVDGRDVAADGATLDDHVGDFANPHGVTADQAGADPAGTAALAVSNHEAAFDHGNIPSALPVPVAEGGTGATDAETARANLGIPAAKAGIVPAASFAGNPATATVTFATPYPAGTDYVVELTAVTSDAGSITTPNVLAKSVNGFTVTLGGKAKDLVEIDWFARPVGE